MRLLSSDSANIVHLSITSSRYLIVFWLLACAEVLSSTAIAQDDEYRATGQCIIPEVSFWSLPMTDNGAVPVSVEFFLLDLVEISDKDSQFFRVL